MALGSDGRGVGDEVNEDEDDSEEGIVGGGGGVWGIGDTNCELGRARLVGGSKGGGGCCGGGRGGGGGL